MPVTTRRNILATAEVAGVSAAAAVGSLVAGTVTSAIATRLSGAAADDLPRVVTPNVEETKRAKRQTENPSPPEVKRPRRGRPPKTKVENKADTKDIDTLIVKRPGRPPESTLAAASPAEASAKNDTETSTPKTTVVKPPPDWEEVYQLVQELRQDRTAPCDHSGCEALALVVNDARAQRFYALVALMLSSQTKDAVVAAAMRKMHDDRVLTPAAIVALERSQLTDHYLYSVGFRNNKATYLQKACQILIDQYDEDIPPTADDMMALPGVGPKMAYICENVAWDRQSGIGVDTHMHRLFGLLKWAKNCKTPEHTRLALQAWLPQQYWKDVNLLWVGFGQEVQQEKEKILKKALACSQPKQALRLLQRCGMDVRKEGRRYGLEEKVGGVLNNTPKTKES